MVANAGWSCKLKVVNSLPSGLQWVMDDYAFGAGMKPGECTIFGISQGQNSVELTQCVIGDGPCTSLFGPTKTIDFNVVKGETYAIDVGPGFF